MSKVQLGDEVRCKVTGFQGIVTQTTQCLTGCDRLGVQAPLKKDGSYGDFYSLDEASVDVLKKLKVKPQSVQEETKKGGPAVKLNPRR